MLTKSKQNLSFLIVGLFFCVQFIIFQFFLISSLKQQIAFSEKSKQIQTDQIQDLTYQLSQLKTEQQFEATKHFVAGVVEAISNKNYYAEIWHSGYDRGSAVTQYAQDVQNFEKKNKDMALPVSIKD